MISLKFLQFRIGRCCGLLWPVSLLTLLLVLASAESSQSSPLLSAEQKAWLEARPVIRVAPDPGFPPVESFDSSGQFVGIAAQILSLVENRIGHRFTVVRYQTWSEVLEAARSRDVDILSAAAATPQREEYLSFTSPHLVLPGVIITRKDVTQNLNLKTLEGMSVCIVSGYLWEELINRDYPGIRLNPVPDIKTGLRKVSFGLADAMVENVATAIQALEEEGITNLRVSGETGYQTRLGFAIRRDWPELAAILEQALADIGPDMLRSVRERWIHIEQPRVAVPRRVRIFALSFLGGLILLVVIVVAGNHALARQVRQRTRELEQELSQRRLTEQALRESEHKFLVMVDTANSIILRMDTSGKVTFFNDFASRFFGFTKSEIIGRNVVGTIVPRTDSYGRDLAAKIVDIALHPETYSMTENENVCKDGRHVWVAWSNKPIFDKEGKLTELLCVGNDITQLKSTESALKKERDLANAIFETAGALQVVLDTQGRVVRFNRTCEQVTGYDQQEVLGRYVWDLFVPEQERDRVRELCVSIQRGNFPNHAENHWICKTGTHRLISWYNTAIVGDPGEVEYVISTGIDITELRRADEELRRHRDHLGELVAERTRELSSAVEKLKAEVQERRRAEEALRESERRYRFLFEASPAGSLILGIDGTIKDINRAFLRSLGLTREETVGYPTIGFVAQQDREATAARVGLRFQGEEMGEVETGIVAKDGSVHTILFSSSQTLLYEGGNLVGMLISGTDVTERRRSEQLARRHQEQLIQADKMVSLGILVSGVAHEINNPNNFILLNSENLRDIWHDIVPILDNHAKVRDRFQVAGLPYEEIRAETGKLITGIAEGSRRIKKIVDSLKDYARRDPGDMDQTVEVNAVIESAIVIMANLVRKSTDRFTVNYGAVPAFRGNIQQIEQVVINLVTNACQALTDKTQAITIKTEYRDEGCVAVTVEDEGRGIAADNLKHIMDPFFTTKRDSGGTGLGLAISYAIVKNHGGILTIDSRLGTGTTARVVLPTVAQARECREITGAAGLSFSGPG